jgi:hypothetical protein
MREVVGILHNLTDMRWKASACISLHRDMVPMAYHRGSHWSDVICSTVGWLEEAGKQAFAQTPL